MQPITRGVLLSISLFAVAFWANHQWAIPTEGLLLHAGLKSLVLMGITVFVLLRFRLSEDLYSMAKKMLAPLGIRLKD
jgi:hypothetical protein